MRNRSCHRCIAPPDGRIGLTMVMRQCIAIISALAALWAPVGVAIDYHFSTSSVDSRGAFESTAEYDQAPANEESGSVASPANDGSDSNGDKDASEFNLDTLITKLKETKALGVFTKLALKGDMEEIIAMANGYQRVAAFSELQSVRELFDGLVLKTITLLNDKDPNLAADMYQARDLVWQSILEAEI